MSGFDSEQLKQMKELFFSEFDRRFNALEAHVDKKVSEVKREIDAVKAENLMLKSRLCTLESKATRSEVEILGFPMNTKLEPREVMKRLALAAGLTISHENILSAKRTGPPKISNGVSCKDITIEFHEPNHREQVILKTNELRKTKKVWSSHIVSKNVEEVPISVVRKISKELKKLKWLANQRKTALNYEFCWISRSGKLCMKKTADSPVITISCEENLLNLK